MERGIRLPNENDNSSLPNGKNYLLAIGIDKYQYWDQLNNAVKDVKDFAQVLVSQYQFEEEDVYYLLDEAATEGRIYEIIRELKRKINTKDNLIVYYSGHGHYDDEFEEGHWIPVDAQKGTEDRYLSNANIIRRINAIKTHHTLMIVDSCFSGTLVVKKRSGIVDERFKSRRILASGRTETVADGQPGENSPFAKGILTFLRKNSDKSINTTTLIQYVKSYVEGKARQTPVEGRIQNSDDEGGEFVFHLKMDEEDLWLNVATENTLQSYENYLDYFPSGQFVSRAKEKILEFKEEGIWKSALNKNNELAFENYIRKYSPYGKYLDEAHEKLRQLKDAHQKRKQALEALAEKEEQRTQIKAEFKKLIETAEQAFNKRELAVARDDYRKSLDFFMPGFIPTQEYIEEQINFCSNGIKFLEYYDNGVKAMDRRNYRLALQYFNEANLIDDNPKLEDLIRVCRQKLEHPKASATVTPIVSNPTQAPKDQPLQKAPIKVKIQRKKEPQKLDVKKSPPPRRPQPQLKAQKSSGSSRMWGCLLGVLATLTVIVILVVVVLNQSADYSPPIDYGDSGEVYQPDVKNLLIGSWKVVGVNVNGYNVDSSHPTYGLYYFNQYTFGEDGIMYLEYSGITETYNYSVDGDILYLPGNNSYLITKLNDSRITAAFYFTGGDSVVITYDRL